MRVRFKDSNNNIRSGQISTLKSFSSDYIELEYIESNGTQYIDTNFTPNQNSGVEIVAQSTMNETASYRRLFGTRENTNINAFFISTNKVNDNHYVYASFANGSATLSSASVIDNLKHTYKFIKNVFYYDDYSYTFTQQNFTCVSHAYLFGVYNSGTINPSSWRIFDCKIYDNNTLVRNLIPAIRKSDNEIGMLDRVNNVFYTNQGTGTFIAGPAKELPSEYQQVEYIESSGTQWIDTQVEINNGFANRVAIIDFSISSLTVAGTGNYSSLFGANYSLQLGWYADGKFTDGSGSSNTVLNINTRYIYKGDYNDGKSYINDVNLTTRALNNSQSYIYLFRSNDGSSSTRYLSSGKIYSAKIYENSILIRNFIPCYRKADNEIGLYDLVNNVFYTNAGTGTFLKGNNVNKTLHCKIAGGSSDIYYGYNQYAKLVDSMSSNVWTYNKVNEYTFTISADNTSRDSLSDCYPLVRDNTYDKIETGHKVLCLWTNDLPGSQYIIFNRGNSTYKTVASTEHYAIFDIVDKATANPFFAIRVPARGSIPTTTETIQIIDLTDWFGAGKEPSTVAEFREKFTKEYYGFCTTPIKLTQYQIEALPSYNYNQMFKIMSYNGTTGYNYNNEAGVRTFDTANNSSSVTVDSTGAIGVKEGRLLVNYSTTIVNTHKYLLKVKVIVSQSMSNKAIAFRNGDNYWKNSTYTTWNEGENDIAFIFTSIEDYTGTSTQIRTYGITAADDGATLTYKDLQCFDLTDWYGAGSEPATVEEFEQTFSNIYYPYSKQRLLNKYMINKLIS